MVGVVPDTLRHKATRNRVSGHNSLATSRSRAIARSPEDNSLASGRAAVSPVAFPASLNLGDRS